MAASSPFDELPYVDLPIPQAQLEQLAAIGKIRGLQPADVNRARVLELGCANGRNLLAMAERRPHSTFVGIDNSEKQIAAAQETCRHLGIENVSFRRESILELQDEPEAYDFIIANGVYSWVDDAVRDRLMAICGRGLAPSGIAFISYNTYPGWHIQEMFRHLMLYNARGATSMSQMIERGRSTLEFLKASLPPTREAYHMLVQAEADRLLKGADWYLRYDHMNEVSQPFYFRQFMAHAQSHGLQLLGDGTLGIRLTDELDIQAEAQLDGITSDLVEREEYRDILRNRPFRQTLLCHNNIEVRRSITPKRLEGLWVEADVRPQNPQMTIVSNDLEKFDSSTGLQISTTMPLVKAALLHLGEIWPRSIEFTALVDVARARVTAADSPANVSAEDIDRLKENLMISCFGRIIDVLAASYPFTTQISPRPAASPLARWQAEQGQIATNRKHQSLRLNQLDRHVLRLSDGTRETARLLADLIQTALAGDLIVMEKEARVTNPERVGQLLADVLLQSLQRLSRNAFLIA